MMELRPIVVDSEGMILGGNMRFKALKELKYKDIPDTWVKRADELTDEEKQRFIIEDNVPFGEWDFELLGGWDKNLLLEWGLELPITINDNDIKDISNVNIDNYRIEISLKDENSQEQLYNELIERGYSCRILTL